MTTCRTTNIPIGMRIRIINCPEEDLNGLKGKTTHSFSSYCTEDGWIGIYLDGGGQVNVKKEEIEFEDPYANLTWEKEMEILKSLVEKMSTEELLSYGPILAFLKEELSNDILNEYENFLLS